MHKLLVLCVTLGACVQEVHRGGRVEVDGGLDDGGLECDQPQTFYADHDGDGFGDPSAPVPACAQPAGTVQNHDDCDDADASRHPGATDVCDGIDNDCSALTLEACPSGCQVARRPPPDDAAHVYLFCSVALQWQGAQATCANAGFSLVELDDAAENVFVRSTGNTLLGTGPFHIGANDLQNPGVFVWDGGDTFWLGGANGTAQNNHFVAWAPAEPNGSDRCVELRTDNRWYDNLCGDAQRFVCRR